MVEEIQSEESDDDDSTSEEETPIKTNPPNRDSRSVPQNTSTLCTVTLSYTEIGDRNMHISEEVIIISLHVWHASGKVMVCMLMLDVSIPLNKY